MKEVKLPKFKLAGELNIYEEGDVVRNPFSGETYELDKYELSVYDYILGLQSVIDVIGVFNKKSMPYQQDMRKGLDWFRRKNPEAYMVLLD